jgi:hypothetical protein
VIGEWCARRVTGKRFEWGARKGQYECVTHRTYVNHSSHPSIGLPLSMTLRLSLRSGADLSLLTSHLSLISEREYFANIPVYSQRREKIYLP